ncbi:conserved hypothetical protein [Alteromonas sp. 38]|uniref:polysaccharide pyruvyl transferase family protein n=1 Tax=Alteromonas TaxID=226 RepID=UPI0012F04C69|nr:MULTISPECIES: polysaccharide pyruvyl transferase family protein [Alteromonas]CAD5265399.1 conserved hypothetical protein [Alteromonas sp. 154]VXC11591.1 conserved hypothetical protein [Alteromonas sp. 38]
MKKIVLYGAFDRYNYGDNLMPILLESFVEQYLPNLKQTYEFEYASITRSNLTNYKCLPTTPIDKVLKNLQSGSVVIVVGGEVIGASRDILFLHSFENKATYSIFRSLKWRFPRLYKALAKFSFNNVSSLPYVLITDDFQVFFNTVGGRVQVQSEELKDKSVKSLTQSGHLAVRDKRTMNAMNAFVEPLLVPDSVHIITKLITDDFLATHLSQRIAEFKNNSYVAFQASPIKLSCDEDTIIAAVKKLNSHSSAKVVLLPIGYASGHDDFELLSQIHSKLPQETVLLTDLNVWEIMYVIKNASAFYGTSLHGVITAFAFGKPHYCINKNIDKVNAYIKDWSVAPYNESIDLVSIETTFTQIPDPVKLQDKAEELAERVVINNKSMFSKLLP